MKEEKQNGVVIKEEQVRSKGTVEGLIEYNDGTPPKKICIHNALVDTGRQALASSLANDVNNTYDFYINRMLFGDSGTQGGTPKYVSSERNGLFGTTRVSKPVISSIDPNNPNQVVLTSVIAYSEGNGYALSEMALQMASGDFYSMTTFPDLTKTAQMQITWNWRVSFV